MKKLALSMVVLLGLVVTLGSSPASAQDFEISIPESAVIGPGVPPGTVADLPGSPFITPAAYVGQDCTIIATGLNQDSAHPNSDILVGSPDTNEGIEIFDVEADPFKVTPGSGSFTLGTTIEVAVRIGGDGVFSGGIRLDFDCSGTPTVTPAAPVYTPGDCDGPGSVVTTDTDAYTWQRTGPDNAVVVTAVANPGYTLTGQTVYGPYDITQTTEGCDTPVTPAVPVFTPGDCDDEGSVVTTDTDAYTWQRTGPDTAVVVTAVANPGYTLTGQTVYGPYDITQPTEGCDAPVTPAAPVFTPGDCDDEGSLVATDTDEYTWTITGPDTALIATATPNPGFGLTGQTVYGPYDITQPTEGCTEPTINVAAFTPVCQADIPFVAWNIVVTGTTANTADITFLDLDGNVVETLTDQPLSGRTIYPGASEDPQDWPGWQLNSEGLWVPDPSDANLRDGLDIVVEVNPTAEAAVQYPAATEACASPTNPTPTPGGGAGSNQPGGGAASNLPVTGGETLLTALFALLLLSAGGSVILFARRNPS